MAEERTVRYKLPKAAMLCGKSNIEELFRNSSSFCLHPFLVKFIPVKDAKHHRMMVSVPKKKFKRAVDRNLIKRRIKEAYRLKLRETILHSEQSYHIAIIYLDRTILPYAAIESKLNAALIRLSKQKRRVDEENH